MQSIMFNSRHEDVVYFSNLSWVGHHPLEFVGSYLHRTWCSQHPLFFTLLAIAILAVYDGCAASFSPASKLAVEGPKLANTADADSDSILAEHDKTSVRELVDVGCLFG